MIIKIETESHHLFEYDIDWQSGEGELIDNRKMGGRICPPLLCFNYLPQMSQND